MSEELYLNENPPIQSMDFQNPENQFPEESKQEEFKDDIQVAKESVYSIPNSDVWFRESILQEEKKAEPVKINPQALVNDLESKLDPSSKPSVEKVVEKKPQPIYLFEEFSHRCKEFNPQYYLSAGDHSRSLSYSTFDEFDLQKFEEELPKFCGGDEFYEKQALKSFNECKEKFPDDPARLMLRFYTHETEFYKKVNSALYNFNEEEIKRYENEIKGLRLAFRFIDPPDKEMTFKRGIYLEENQIKVLKANMKMPAIFANFTSTTAAAQIPSSFKDSNVILEIIYRPSVSFSQELDEVFPANLKNISCKQNEEEYLFPCFQSFRILKIESGDKGKITVKMEHCPLNFYMNVPRFLFYDLNLENKDADYEKQKLRLRMSNIPENELQDVKVFFSEQDVLLGRLAELEKNRLVSILILDGQDIDAILTKLEKTTEIDNNRWIKTIKILCDDPSKFQNWKEKSAKIEIIANNLEEVESLLKKSNSSFLKMAKENMKIIYADTFKESRRIIHETVDIYHKKIADVIKNGDSEDEKVKEDLKNKMRELQDNLQKKLNSIVKTLEYKVHKSLIKISLTNRIIEDTWKNFDRNLFGAVIGGLVAIEVVDLAMNAGHYQDSNVGQILKDKVDPTMGKGQNVKDKMTVWSRYCVCFMGVCAKGGEEAKKMADKRRGLKEEMAKISNDFNKMKEKIENELDKVVQELDKTIDDFFASDLNGLN